MVGVVMGSPSDRSVMDETVSMLERFGVPHEVVVLSAHRRPDATRQYAKQARERGLKVLIAGAGLAAHLPGALAAHTMLPVIGVPIPGSTLGGLDSLLSIVQMPAGIPVATMSLGVPGARNAALLAVAMLALSNDQILIRLQAYRAELAGEAPGSP